MEQFLQAETLVIELLLVVSLVAVAVRRLQVPYTVALVVVGLMITLQTPVELSLMPGLILALFVPPLVFEAAFHLDVAELQRNLPHLLMLAVFGVIVTTLIVGGLVALTTPLALPVALVLGALTAATDPVSVVAVFRRLGVPRRLSVLLEGESLLNDGTAIVVFGLVLVAALSGRFDPVRGVLDFARTAAGGVVVGLGLGWMISRMIERLDDYLIETTLTTVLAFGSYLVAERLHFSGVLAVVTAGLVNGNLSPQGMSPTTRIVLFNFWEYVAFLANSLVFLLIGLQVNIPALVAAWRPVFWGVLAVLVARVVVVYGFVWVANRFGNPVPLRWQHVLSWGGLRGAISLALVLSLPASLGPERDLLRVMAFGVVLFTLIVQGTTMGPLLRWLRVVTRSEAELEYEVRRARLTALQEAGRHLERLFREGLLSSHAWEALRPELTQNAVSLGNELAELLRGNPTLQAEELEAARREVYRAERSALLGLRQGGMISAEAYERLTAELDAAYDENLAIPLVGSGPPAGTKVDQAQPFGADT